MVETHDTSARAGDAHELLCEMRDLQVAANRSEMARARAMSRLFQQFSADHEARRADDPHFTATPLTETITETPAGHRPVRGADPRRPDASLRKPVTAPCYTTRAGLTHVVAPAEQPVCDDPRVVRLWERLLATPARLRGASRRPRHRHPPRPQRDRPRAPGPVPRRAHRRPPTVLSQRHRGRHRRLGLGRRRRTARPATGRLGPCTRRTGAVTAGLMSRVGELPPRRAQPAERSRSATHSTWCVIGNRSKARSRPSL